ncbi:MULTISPECIES: DUF305 domain-containing protein [Marinomonas]|uniref:DUF305 domain-containing protein n=1 Tax=Marinomonas arctica TaxID=383750 RepID=A0A7H1J5J5_9GAMM|nr:MULTISPECIES: DUF305 domain-containing protein [Marinomonas]QNT05761.1 DUF305 domain-containing protein [Marinomonas arctica]GGN36650.1 hypothetical protein GCM10011350_35100 [Marinomonas arctica]
MTFFQKYFSASVLLMMSLVLAGCTFLSPANDTDHPIHHSEHVSQFTQSNQHMMMQMHSTELTGDVDYDFVTGMVPHHQGAIDMATQLLASAQVSDKLKPLAEDVVAAQSSEIAFMQDWLVSYGEARPSADAEQIKAAYAAINATMMADMHGLSASGDVNRDFIDGMIPHHEAAVAMAKVLLQFSRDPALIKMAQTVISEQTREINVMRQY